MLIGHNFLALPYVNTQIIIAIFCSVFNEGSDKLDMSCHEVESYIPLATLVHNRKGFGSPSAPQGS